MIIPIRTDYRMSRVPWMNYLIILANVGLFLATVFGKRHMDESWLLHPDDPQLYQYFTCMFLHGGWAHIVGNMIFLWVFGNAVNDRFGQAGYLAFYLAGGVLAGVGYLLMGGNAPVLGASGAISAVTGAYLVLLPKARVTLLVWLFYVILPIEISSLFFLLFQFVWNMAMSLNGWFTNDTLVSGGVAYAAHSSGYVFGIAVAALILGIRVLPRSPYDLPSLLHDWNRRRQYQQMIARGYDPFSFQRSAPMDAAPEALRVPSRTLEQAPPDTPVARELELRREISQSLASHELGKAARLYQELSEIAPNAVLSRSQQLDVANQLMADEQYLHAAEAYEQFVRFYQDYEHLADIFLMLGLVYGRYLHQDQHAAEYLGKAIERLKDPRKMELAKADLDAIQQRRP